MEKSSELDSGRGGKSETVKVSNNVTRLYEELGREWPELLGVSKKLASMKELNREDWALLRRAAHDSGWDLLDIVEDLKFSHLSPLKRAKRYRQLFDLYFSEVKKEGGSLSGQAVERLWGATTALVKLHAAASRTPVVQWSLKSLQHAAQSVEILNSLLDAVCLLRRCFHEGVMDKAKLRRQWTEAVVLLEEAKKSVERKGKIMRRLR